MSVPITKVLISLNLYLIKVKINLWKETDTVYSG